MPSVYFEQLSMRACVCVCVCVRVCVCAYLAYRVTTELEVGTELMVPHHCDVKAVKDAKELNKFMLQTVEHFEKEHALKDTVNVNVKDDWLKCVKCDKWRKITPEYKAQHEHNDDWTCSTRGGPVAAHDNPCSVPQDFDPSQNTELPTAGNGEDEGGGKLTVTLKRPADAEAQPAAKRQKAVKIEKVVPEAAVCPSCAILSSNGLMEKEHIGQLNTTGSGFSHTDPSACFGHKMNLIIGMCDDAQVSDDAPTIVKLLTSFDREDYCQKEGGRVLLLLLFFTRLVIGIFPGYRLCARAGLADSLL